MAVRLTKIHVGPCSLNWEQLAPAHKKRIESSLSSYFLKRPELISNKKFSVTVELTPEFKEVERIVRYYQHMGLLPLKKGTKEESAIGRRTSAGVVEAMRKAAIPGTNERVIAGARITEDSLSLTRNILFAIPSIGSDDPIVNHLGYYAGMLWTFFAFRELDGGWTDYKRAAVIGDTEGKVRAQARLASGSIVSAASMAYLSGKVCDTMSASAASTSFLGFANVLFGIGSLLSMSLSALAWTRCYRFNARLNEYLENPKFDHAQKLQGALRFLKDHIAVTPEEMANVKAQIEKEHPLLKPEERGWLIKQKLADLTEIKLKYLKRRTSNKSLHLILRDVDSILTKLEKEETRAVGIKEATILIQTVQTENLAKMALNILCFTAAAISVIAMMLFTVLSATAVLPFVLYGIAGAIYLSMSLYNLAGVLKKDPGHSSVELHPIQDLGSHEVH